MKKLALSFGSIFFFLILCPICVQAAVSFDRSPRTKLRVVNHNIFINSVFPDDDGTPGQADRIEEYKRFAQAIDADIWVMQEVFHGGHELGQKTPQGLKTYFDNLLSKDHYISYDEDGRFLFSIYPIIWETSVRSRVRLSLIDLPPEVSSRHLVVMSMHLPTGTHNRLIAQDVARYSQDIIAGRIPEIPADSMILICGDLNSGRSEWSYNIILSGDADIANVNDYDKGNTPFQEMDFRYINLPEEDSTFGSVNFSGSTFTGMAADARPIDFVFARSSHLQKERAFSVNTLTLTDAELSSLGLQKLDSARDPKQGYQPNIHFDHIPMVLDLYDPNDALPNHAEFVAYEGLPESMDPGETVTIGITMRNAGNEAWSSTDGHSLGTESERDNELWTGETRVPLPETTAPGEKTTFQFDITAPGDFGLYDFQWQMVDDLTPNDGWFGFKTPLVKIPVGPQPIHIEAEDFAVNSGFQTQGTSDTGGGLNVGFTDVNDFLEYDVVVEQAGVYHASFRVASYSAGTRFDLILNGEVLCSVDEAATGDWQAWITSQSQAVLLPEGTLRMRIYASHSGWNLNWFRFDPVNNQAPIISSSPNEYIEVDSTYTYTIQASDPDQDDLSFNAIERPQWLSFDGANQTLSGTPSSSDIGPHLVTIEANDGQISSSQSFRIFVSAIGNDPPLIEEGQVAEAIAGHLLSYEIVAVDPDGDSLLFSSTDLPSWLHLDSTTGLLSGGTENIPPGLYAFSVNVFDGALTTNQTAQILLYDDASSANLITNGNFASGSSGWNMQSSTFIENGTLKIVDAARPVWQVVQLEPNTDYRLTARLLAANVVSGDLVLDTNDVFDPGMTPGGSAQFVVNAARAGIWTEFSGTFNTQTLDEVRIRIFGSSMTGTAYVDDLLLQPVIPNTTPVVLSTAPLEIESGALYQYTFRAKDYEDNTLTYSAESLPTWLNFDPTSGLLSGTPEDAAIGQHSIRLVARDSRNAATVQAFTLTVTAANPFENWKTAHGVVENLKDDDGDGIINAIEFALGGDPKLVDATSVAPAVSVATGDLVFQFKRSEASISYIVQTSDTLGEWPVEDSIPINDGHGPVGEMIELRFPLSNDMGHKKFLRLKIEGLTE